MKIAILEDNPQIARMLQLNLENDGYETHAFHEVKVFLGFFTASSGIDLLITDYRLKSEHEKSGMSGADVIRHVRKDRPELPVILISAASMFELEDAVKDIDEVHIMQKPFPVKQLLGTIQALSR